MPILIFSADQINYEKKEKQLEEKCTILEKYLSLQLIQVANPMYTNGMIKISGAATQPQFIMQLAVNVYIKYEIKEGQEFDVKSFLTNQVSA